MKITTQDGKVIIAHNIEISGCVVKCTPKEDMRKREVCGEYKDRIRATEIFAEMTCIGWNTKNPQYTMPKE